MRSTADARRKDKLSDLRGTPGARRTDIGGPRSKLLVGPVMPHREKERIESDRDRPGGQVEDEDLGTCGCAMIFVCCCFLHTSYDGLRHSKLLW